MRANGRLAPATAHAHPPVMFSVTEAGATTIRDAFRQRGELSAVIELRRLFPGVTDNRQARECVRIIAGWGCLSRSIPHRQSLRPPATSAGMSSMCSFAIDLTARTSASTRR